MKLKSFAKSDMESVLTDSELKSVSSLPVLWSCICNYKGEQTHVYITKPLAGCSVTTCIQDGYCSNSWLCEAIENTTPSGSGSGSGSEE